MMTKDETITLLQHVKIVDNRTLDAVSVAEWHSIAAQGNWTLEDALDAVRKHRATNSAYLTPGHIGEILRERRRQPVNAAQLALGRGKPASAETRRAIMAQMRGMFASPES